MDGDSKRAQLCTVCSEIRLTTLLTSELKHEDAFHLGTLEDIIYKAKDCEMCAAVVASFQARQPWSHSDAQQTLKSLQAHGDDTEVWLYSYVFMNEQPVGDITLRIGVSTNKSGLHDRFSRYTHAGDLQITDAAAGRVGVSPERRGRRIATTANMALAQQWLQECLHDHGELCSKSDSQATSSSRPNRLRVIDIRERCLLNLPTGAEYLALSYCWPKDPGLTNTLAQASSLYKAGAITLENGLSHAIDDACKAVCDLGQQYLWVDALCIIQDSPADKADQIEQMDLVYNTALMTIVIAPENNNEIDQASSLPGYRTASSSRRQIIHSVGHLSFAVPKPCVEDVLVHTRWETRGWTYQESHLSRRSLYFTSHQLYFQCSCGIRSEDTSGEGHMPTAFIHHSTTLWNPKNKHAADPEYDRGDLILSHNGYENDAKELRAYNNFATYYTHRSLSFPSDTLNAFRGIEKVLAASLKTEFYAGLPLKYLDCVLLWQSSDAAGRREDFPSFAWAGWMGLHECPYWLSPEDTGRLVRWWRVVGGGTYLACETATMTYAASSSWGESESQTGVMEAAQMDMLPPPPPLPQQRPWGLATITQVARFGLALDSPAEISDAEAYQSGQHHWILDAQQRRAGLILIDNAWRQRSQNASHHTKQQHDFILLSRASKARVGDDDDTFKCFDMMAYEDREWCLVNVMLVEWVGGDDEEGRGRGGVAERMAVGVVHCDAWDGAGVVTRGVCLV